MCSQPQQIDSWEDQVFRCWSSWALHKGLKLLSFSLSSCPAILLCFQCFHLEPLSLPFMSMGQWKCFVQQKTSLPAEGWHCCLSPPLLPHACMCTRVSVPSLSPSITQLPGSALVLVNLWLTAKPLIKTKMKNPKPANLLKPPQSSPSTKQPQNIFFFSPSSF